MAGRNMSRIPLVTFVRSQDYAALYTIRIGDGTEKLELEISSTFPESPPEEDVLRQTDLIETQRKPCELGLIHRVSTGQLLSRQALGSKPSLRRFERRV